MSAAGAGSASGLTARSTGRRSPSCARTRTGSSPRPGWPPASTVNVAAASPRGLSAADRDAPCVARLAAAGLVCLGKTNLSEFAYSGLGLNPHFGTPRNPAAPGRVPGGSSSGSAAAVAGGAAPCAIGTDTSGSVRIPAAFMGLAGYKPSQNRFSRQGVVPLPPSLDSAGTLARPPVDFPPPAPALAGQPYTPPPPP